MNILETERLLIREMDSAIDAEFVFELLNTPKFIQYIGDRGLRTLEQSRDFIENRYRQSYRDHGYGLYTVEIKDGRVPIGICGFVRRDTLPKPDIGFAFLPQYERKGYGYESASEMMKYGRNSLGFGQILAITSLDNVASSCLLERLGFSLDKIIEMPNGEAVNLYSSGEN